jgi:hypothetical protein
LSRLLEIGKCQDIVAPVNTSSVATGAEVLQSINDSTSGSAAAALAIAQIAARSKILAAREEQIFNQYANEAICLQLKRLEKRIENLQQVESAVVIQGKVFFNILSSVKLSLFFTLDIRSRWLRIHVYAMGLMFRTNLVTKCVDVEHNS